jgi:hypothetical protein
MRLEAYVVTVINRNAATRRPTPPRKWGWMEVFVLSQSFFPAMLFIPGLSSLRLLTRVAAFLIAPLFWFLIYCYGKHLRGGENFAVRPLLLGVSGWLGLCLIHPDTNWPIAGIAQIGLYVSIFSPVFWVGWVLHSPRQISRLMGILFICNAFSAALGIAQVFRPDTFNPPVIPALSTEFGRLALTYTADDGRQIIRPCGLGDTPGQASTAGAMACLIGLAWALRPIAWWKRIASLGLAFLGVAVIYYSQIRALMVVLVICLFVLTIMFILQRSIGKATLLIFGSTVLIGGALIWVSQTVGSSVVTRFGTLWTSDPFKLYSDNRGGFITSTFDHVLVQNPLGMGLGRHGQIYDYFGNRAYTPIWVEVQWPAWAVDGGFLLMGGYVIAIILAMFDTFRVALTTTDRELADWAAVVVAANLSIVAATFSQIVFLAPIGLQFWLLSSAIHVADYRVKAAQHARRRAAMIAHQQAMEVERVAAVIAPTSAEPRVTDRGTAS